MEAKILEFLKQNKIKYKLSGDEIVIGCIVKECPNFGQPQFYINKATGRFLCHRCNAKGNNLAQLAFKAGLITFKEPSKAGSLHISDEQVEKWHKSLFASKAPLKHLIDERGITEQSIIQFRLGLEVAQEGECIIIPYFDKDQICVGYKKYFYTHPPGVPKIKFAKDSKIQLFNLNCVNLEEPLIITEGEFDTITAWQYGYTNVGSMPNGANGVEGWTDEIANAPRFLICTDNDRAGEEASIKLGEKLGLSKCVRVTPRLKDLNEYAQCGLGKDEVDKIFRTGCNMFNAPVMALTEYSEEAKEALLNPEKVKGVSTGWSSLDHFIQGIRGGEVTVTSGLTGDGKTTFADALIGNICHDLPCLIVSPEMNETDILLNLASNFQGHRVANSQEVDEFISSVGDRIQIANVFDSWTNRKKVSLLDRVFDLIDFSVRDRGIKFVLLDHLHLFINPTAQDGERVLIDSFMQRCVHSAISNDIHIWLVVQPRGLPANQRKVTMHDLKGSSAIAQDSHNVILIHRNRGERETDLVEIEIGKNRKFGMCGVFNLKFDLNSRSNYYDLQ